MTKQSSRKESFSYAWVILFVLFFGMLVSFGMRASFGAYISPWEYEFSVSRTTVTLISMLSFAVFAIGQPFAGKLNDHFGRIVPIISVFFMGLCLVLTSMATQMWQIFALFGIGFSIGISGCGHNVSASIITNWFVEKRGFALGLMTSGMAIGMFAVVPANLFIIDALGWRVAMRLFGIIIIVLAGPLYIFLLRNFPKDKGMKPFGFSEEGSRAQMPGGVSDEEKKLPVLGIMKTRAFWLLAIPYFICGFTDVGLIATHLIPMAEGKGFTVAVVAAAFSLIALSNIGGTIVSGHLSDHFSRKRQLAFIYAFRAVTFVLLLLLRQPWLLFVFAAAYGAVEMASIAPTNSISAELFDKYSTGTVLGLVAVSHQLGGAIGSWVPGIMYDSLGSYSTVIIISIVALAVMAWMSLGIPEPKIVKKVKP